MFFFKKLPEEIKTLIFEFDSTEKEKFDRVIHQLQYIPVLQQLKRNIKMYQVSKDLWWICFLENSWSNIWFRVKKENPERIESIRKGFWKEYLETDLYWNL